ncbi:MAG: putative glycoside hydrolase, partial [Rhodanobacter sp.]
FNFSGTLAMPWPGAPCPYAKSGSSESTRWLFTPGYGLHYADDRELPRLATYPAVDACADASGLSVFHTLAVPPFALYLSDDNPAHPPLEVGADVNSQIAWPASHPVLRLSTVQVNTQQDAKSITWLGTGRFYAKSAPPRDLMPLASAHAALQFDVVISTPASAPVQVYMGCGHDCLRSVDLRHAFAGYANGSRHTVSIPLQCFIRQGADLSRIDVPFGVQASSPFSAAFANVKIVAGTSSGRHDFSCKQLGSL